ncbi:ParB/RepB/Spo0J family partition protein [Kitasatospora griseola]|uniref:ParB/RepB/Spo0J family partition protein n=1 Tax=Kitasatospora griseola TaxID=2064 RepID=UPI0038048256
MAAHDDFDDFFDDDPKPEKKAFDTRADGRLLRVPLARLAPNGVNPRRHFGTEDELIDLGKSLSRRQIQACAAVSRGAYLKLWPDHEEQVGRVDYVLVSGERRYRGAAAAGNEGLTCVIDDGLAADRKTFLEAVVSENVDRQNFDPVEEAYAVQALVAEFGSNRAVAEHFERADGWVTQRILLTHLAPEIQDLVRTKAMPIEAARSLGKLARDKEWTAAQQLAWWKKEQQNRAEVSAKRSVAKKAAAGSAPSTGKSGAAADRQEGDPFYGRKTGAADPATNQSASTEQPSATTEEGGAPTVPGQGGPAGAAADEQPDRFPYGDGTAAALDLIERMPAEELATMLDLLTEHIEHQTVPAA